MLLLKCFIPGSRDATAGNFFCKMSPLNVYCHVGRSRNIYKYVFYANIL